MIFRALERASRVVERVLLGAIAAVSVVLVVVVVSAVAAGGGASVGDGGRAVAEREPTPRGAATQGGEEHNVPASQDDRGDAAPAAGGPTEYLCAPLDDLLYLRGDGVAVAADDGGHFGFYSLPEPGGRPSRDSYDLLRGCSADLSFANLTHVEVDGPLATDKDVLGNGRQAESTRRAADGSLVTVHEPSQGLRVTQRLRLVEGPDGRRDALRVSYELENYTDESAPELRHFPGSQPLVVSLSSTLAPPLAVVSRDRSGAPDEPVFESPGAGGVREETVFGGGRVPEELGAPRPGAASDSSGVWTPGPAELGLAPDRLVVAGWLGLAADPLDYRVEPGTPLAENASISAQWTGLRLEPDETLTLSHTYAPGYAQGS